MVRATGCGPVGRGFKSHHSPHFTINILLDSEDNMYYFAYGSNMSISQLKSRGCPDLHFLGPAKVEGYKFVYAGKSPNWGMQATADMVKVNNSEVVWGGLFEVTKDCLELLDVIEHVPKRRKRINIKTITKGGKTLIAVAYTLKSEHDVGEPSKEYRTVLLQGAKDCHLPASYFSNL